MNAQVRVGIGMLILKMENYFEALKTGKNFFDS